MNPITDLLDALRAKLPESSKVITEGATTEVSQSSLTGPIAAVRAAVSAIPNTSNHFPSRESYRDMGYAIKAALPDNEPEAFEIFSAWCDRWADGTNDPDVVASDWRRMKPPYRRGASWLYGLAETYGDFDRASVWFEPVPESFQSLFPEEEKPESSPKRFSLISLQDAAATALTAAAKPLIKGLLDQGTLSVMYGPSNVGKTFAAMDIFFHIAAGMPWGGMRATKGAVVYVAAEGGAGARKRADALCRRYGDQAKDADFNLLLSNIDLLRPDADLNPFIDSVLALGRPISAIGLDTLARVMAGGEENGSVDMGTMVKHFDKIRQATGAHVMIVHHSGKDVAKGSRGHSSLRAATDTEIEISDGQLSVTKQRDLDKEYSTPFRLNVVELGRDADGDPVTSCTIELVARHVEPTSPATPKEQMVLDALNALVSTGSDKGAKVSEIAGFLAEGKADDMTADTVRAHLKNLAKKRQVVCPIRGFWAPKVEFPLAVSQMYESSEVEESGRKLEENIFD